MNPSKLSLLLFALMIAISCCTRSSTQEGLIVVQDYPPNLYEPEINLESHNTGDVEIHRVQIPEEGYLIIFYHDYSGKILNYQSNYFDTTYFEQGLYYWKNDTTVAVKLYNSETKKEWSVELGVRGGSTFMRHPDDQ